METRSNEKPISIITKSSILWMVGCVGAFIATLVTWNFTSTQQTLVRLEAINVDVSHVKKDTTEIKDDLKVFDERIRDLETKK